MKIKGSKSGLQLVFDDAADFAAIEKDIREKLESGSKFFCRGTVIQILSGSLRDVERQRLSELFHAHGVVLRTALPESEEVPAVCEPSAVSDAEPPRAAVPSVGQEMLVIDKTVRGGQEVTSKGSVLICGNVNPGAQVIAGGSIDIRGTCRGIVHAGAYGNTKAFIIADHLMPMQIRIADQIARSPDQVEKSDCAERASIKNGQIIIEPIER